MKKIAINGLGRIGKLVFQYLLENEGYGKDFEIVAINDLTDVSQLAYLLKYDSTQVTMQEKGHTISYKKADTLKEDEMYLPDCETLQGYLIIDEKLFPIFAQPDPTKLPWGTYDVDVVCECTGRFAEYDKAKMHIDAGAKHVIVNAPTKGTKNIVYRINSDTLDGTEDIICGASCTTNCLAPLAKVLDEEFGIVRGLMTTIHSYTADQSILDTPHKKGENSRRGRAAAVSIVPASTGAAEAVAKALPNLKGKLTGMAMRVPTPTGSVVVFDVELNKKITAEQINNTLEAKADNVALAVTYDPVVSADIIGIPYGSYVDLQSTKVLETNEETTMAQIVSWYDNESSYTHQYVNTLINWLGMMK